MIVLSYLPLFTSVPANFSLTQDCADDFIKAIEVSVNLAVGKGIMWIDDDNGRRLPILIFDNGDDIFDHLTVWSDGKPEDWFALNIVELGDGKVEFLVAPRFLKSVERHSRQFPRLGVDGVQLNGLKVLFTPLQVRIDKSDQCVGWLGSLGPVVEIGFIDSDYFLFGDPTKLNFKKCVRVLELKLESVCNSLNSCALLPLFKDDVVIRDYGFLGD